MARHRLLVAGRLLAMAALVASAAGIGGVGALPAAAAGAPSCTSPPPPSSFSAAEPWAQSRLDFQRVWPLTEGAGVRVAVVDTGVDGQQPFLRGAVLRGVDVKNGGGPANTDCDGHGTFIAGLIAGRKLSGMAFAGVAPKATILPIRQANTQNDGTAGTLAAGIMTAVSLNAQVINVSIVTQYPSPVLLHAVSVALAHNVVVVAAVGNDFSNGNQRQYPAALPGVLAVAAVDRNGQRASFSESGSYVGVAAPGVNLTGPGRAIGLVSWGGTSFAAAFVSGTAALVRSYYPHLSAAQVIRRIEATADPAPGARPSPDFGWGIVDPYAAVTAVLPPMPAGSGQGRASVPAPPRPAPVSGNAAVATGVGIGGAALAISVMLAADVVRRGRRRGWRPGQ